jgi:predicted metal-dependent hydrolase
MVFVRHAQARRYLLRVLPDATVRVTLPRWGSRREAKAFAERERPWIEKQLLRVGGSGSGGDGPHDLQDRIPAGPDGRPLGGRKLIRHAESELVPRLHQLARLHGLTVRRITVRNQRSRWGSCSPGGHISLNWRLIVLPDWVRDYVLIHELMHLKRMDHSRRFWKLVEQACPDYRRARRYLRERSVLAN